LPTFCIALAIISPISRSPLAETRADLGDLGSLAIFLAARFKLRHERDHGGIDAALQVHRVHAGGDRLHAFTHDGLRQDGRGGGAVAGDVLGLRGHLAHHLCAHVLELVGQLDLLGDGDAVLGDARRAQLLSSSTLRPLGPSVTFTASARTSTPRSIRLRASRRSARLWLAFFRSLLGAWPG
jgi:hypothetical protein